jgi:ribonuclease VapC
LIVDTSAVIAILFDEPEAPALVRAIRTTGPAAMSAASYVEAAAVIDGIGDPVLSRRLDQLLRTLAITLAPFDAEQAVVARTAYADFGKGSGHPARLNFGDCMTYALAKASGEPLLYVGDDFAATDLHPALPHA